MVRGMRGTTRLTVVLLGTAIALSACSTRTGDDAAAPAAAPTAPTTSAPSAPARQAVPDDVRPTKETRVADTNTARRSTGELAAYFAAAERADAHLRRAAVLVNHGMTKDRLRIAPEAVRAIQAASPQALATTLPPGMPPRLMRPVLLTFSELTSRYYAMRFVLEAGDARREVVVPRDRVFSPTLAEIVEALGNGAPAAERFRRDLAAAKAIAGDYPTLTAGPRSRAAAELATRVEQIVSANGCCVETGGEIFTSLAPLRWTGGRERHSWTGTINGIGFHTTWTGKHWDARLDAG